MGFLNFLVFICFLVGLVFVVIWRVGMAFICWRNRIFVMLLWCWRRLLRVPWTARRSNHLILKKSVLNIHWKYWCWSRNSNTLSAWCEELTPWKRPWRWERLKEGGEGNDRRWDGWMVSLTPWTWVWVNSRNWWWTGKPGVLLSMGLQRVGHDWVTEQQQQQKAGWPDALVSGARSHS